METLTMSKFELDNLLTEAAKKGANFAIAGMVSYNLRDACKQLGITYATLHRRVTEGKIKSIDGRISGAEIQRYMGISPANRR